jgi:hypothetical protein
MGLYGDISDRPAAALRMGHPPGFFEAAKSASELTQPEFELEEE